MDEQTYLALSFAASIGYGALSLAAAVFASIACRNRHAMAISLLACGCAYAAQLCHTHYAWDFSEGLGKLFQALATLCFVAVVVLLGAGRPASQSSVWHIHRSQPMAGGVPFAARSPK